MQRTNNNGIIIIEDDTEFQDLLKRVFASSGYENELLFFNDGQLALDFLSTTDLIPFIVLSDMNIPKLDGFAIRDKLKMDANLQLKCIPYILMSAKRDHEAVVNAYCNSVQGFFIKERDFDSLKDTIDTIMHYWQKCVTPNYFK